MVGLEKKQSEVVTFDLFVWSDFRFLLQTSAKLIALRAETRLSGRKVADFDTVAAHVNMKLVGVWSMKSFNGSQNWIYDYVGFALDFSLSSS